LIYRSNLAAPDLQKFFRHVDCRVMGHSQGHDVLSDFADKKENDPVFGPYKSCGMATHDEAALVYNVALAVGGTWLDIGGLTGWTACHAAAAGCTVYSVDPMYAHAQFRQRAEENISAAGLRDKISLWACTSNEFFSKVHRLFSGVLIDGDHGDKKPSEDAENARSRTTINGVILFHDTKIYYVRKAYHACAHAGWNTRTYTTPHGMGLCYRDGFIPPHHVADPLVT
jgi:predicted O-methyltransferase YrrM